MNINRITQGAVSMTKVMGNHTAKAGIYIEHSYKAQNTGGNLTFQGALNFGVDTNNPLDSQMAFSNAALGIFSTYAQGSQFIEGNFFYNNIEWYLQDNWKVNRKLTLDYGLRFAHDGPYADKLQQVANFFPEKWSKRAQRAGALRRRAAWATSTRALATTVRRRIRAPAAARRRHDRPSSARSSSASGNFANGMVPGRRRHQQGRLHVAVARRRRRASARPTT